jgi:mannose-6-phosphate isomerase-like protein (cupin superfamily)
MQVISLASKFSQFDELWSPKIIAEVNNFHVKIGKLKGEFVWHQHENEDELFLVIKGILTIHLREKDLVLHEGELAVIPKGVEHCPYASQEVHVLMFEPKTTLNTGTDKNDRTVEAEWL